MKALVHTLAILGLTGAMLFGAGQAEAQQVCTTRDDATKQLEDKYGEKVVARGLSTTGKRMLEIFVSENGSWTVVMSEPNGRSCVLVTGESWQQIPMPAGDPV